MITTGESLRQSLTFDGADWGKVRIHHGPDLWWETVSLVHDLRRWMHSPVVGGSLRRSLAAPRTRWAAIRLRHLIHSGGLPGLANGAVRPDDGVARLADQLLDCCQRGLVAPLTDWIDGAVRPEVAAMRALVAESGVMSALAALPGTSVSVEGIELPTETAASHRLAGRGLTVVRAAFATWPVFVDAAGGPVLAYPVDWDAAGGDTGRPHSLLNPTPRRIAELLLAAPRRTSDLAAALGISGPAVSQHLRTLRNAGIVWSGQDRVHELTPAGATFLLL
jgi:hypothetical protein